MRLLKPCPYLINTVPINQPKVVNDLQMLPFPLREDCFRTGPAQKKWDRVINLAPQLRLSLAGLEEQIFPANPKSFYHKTSSHHSQRIDRRNLGPDNEEVRNKNNSHGVLMLFVCDFKLYSYSLRPSNISRKQHLQKMFPCVINSGGDQVSHALPASHLMVFHAFQSTSHS